MKKQLFCMATAMCVLMTTAGCQSDSQMESPSSTPVPQTSASESSMESSYVSSSLESSQPEETNGVQQIKVSDLFLGEGRRIWFQLYQIDSNGNIKYDDSVERIYVIENGKIMGYDPFSSYLQIEKFDGMTDDEIIQWAEDQTDPLSLVEEYPDALSDYSSFIDITFDDQLNYFDNRSEKGECSISFHYFPDTTGNELKSEMVNIEPINPKEYDARDKFGPVKDMYGNPVTYLDAGGEIVDILEPSTVLSKQYFGLNFGSGTNYYPLITRYDFDSPTEIVLNEAGDEGLVRIS